MVTLGTEPLSSEAHVYRSIVCGIWTALATGVLAACGGGGGATGPSGPPLLNSVNGALQASGPTGSTVILQGSNFGGSQGAGVVLFAKTGGGADTAVIATGSDWTNTFIVTTVPGTAAASGPVRVVTTGGTSDSITFTVTQNAAFNPSSIGWSQTTALPAGLSGHAAAFASVAGPSRKDVVYVAGGADSTYAPRTAVYYAAVQASGQLGSWTTAGMALPAPRAFAAAVVATPFNSTVTGPGYLYVLGGDSTAAGLPVATVYVATLDTTGAITGWSATAPLPVPLHSVGAVIFNGNVYVAGGSASGNQPVATVYRAAINSDGSLGDGSPASWKPQASLPFARSYFGLENFGLYLYAFGGDSATVAPNDTSLTSGGIADIAYAKIDIRTGNLVSGGWTKNAGALIKPVHKHTAVVAGGYALVTAGLYNGDKPNGSTEESYAQFNPDGSVGSVSGATGSHTIQSNETTVVLFNHAALSVVDQSGTAHVLVLGGDNVLAPSKMRKEVWIY
jgi:hypothetical protein